MVNRINWSNVYTGVQEDELIERTIEAMRVLISSPARSDIKKGVYISICSDGSAGQYVLTNKGIQWEGNSGKGNITDSIIMEDKWPEIITQQKLTPQKIMKILFYIQAPLYVELPEVLIEN